MFLYTELTGIIIPHIETQYRQDLTMTPGVNRSALRPFDILQAYRTARRPLSLTELSQLTDIPLSTCHSVVRSLEDYGVLYFLSRRESYPTRLLLDMSQDINAHDPLTSLCQPTLTKLRDATQETIILGTRQGDRVLYLMVEESEQTIRYSSRAGDFKPMHSSAIGKVMLAAMPDQQLEKWLAAHDLTQATPNTITHREQLMEDIHASRERGYTITRGENVEDVMALAAPVSVGSMTLGIAVAGPLNRMEKKAHGIAQELNAAVADINLLTV